MSSIEEVIQELKQEAKTTAQLLEIVPEEKLAWKPTPKSMTLGQLALHVATIPGNVSGLVSMDGFDAKTANFTPPQPESSKEILSAFEESIPKAIGVLSSWDQEKSTSKWTLRKGDQEVFTRPRIGVVRTIMLNHWYHHRGQLTVYLRLLGLSLPVTYGRSADINPFD